MGLSIDGDSDEETRDGVDLGLRQQPGRHSAQPPLSTPSPEILLAFGSAHPAGASAFTLPGGSGSSSSHGVSSHGYNSSHGFSTHGISGHGALFSGGREASSRHSGGGVAAATSASAAPMGGMPRVLSWPGLSSCSDLGLTDELEAEEAEEEAVVRADSGGVSTHHCDGNGVLGDMEAGTLKPSPSSSRYSGGGPSAASSAAPSPCYICCERRADAVVMECGHGGMCFKCAQQLVVTPPSQCPVCRKPIQQVLRFERVLPVPSGGSLVGGVSGSRPSGGPGGPGPGGGEAGSGDDAISDELPASGGEDPVVAVQAAVASSTAATTAAPRAVSGSFVRRFMAPDEVAGGGGGGGGAIRNRDTDLQQTGSAPGGDGARDSSRRNSWGGAAGGGGGGAHSQGMSEEGGWLDPV